MALDGYGPWWSYIPHFTGTPGYVYAYAYGYLFSLAIYRRTCARATRWSSRISSSCARAARARPRSSRSIVGLDLTDPAIWASGIDALSEELDEAERLAAEIGLG